MHGDKRQTPGWWGCINDKLLQGDLIQTNFEFENPAAAQRWHDRGLIFHPDPRTKIVLSSAAANRKILNFVLVLMLESAAFIYQLCHDLGLLLSGLFISSLLVLDHNMDLSFFFFFFLISIVLDLDHLYGAYEQCVPAQWLFSPSLCTAVVWTPAQCCVPIDLHQHRLRSTASETHSRISLESVAESVWKPHPFSYPPSSSSLRCSIPLTLTFGAPGSSFTQEHFVKLQHGCALKERSYAINHKKCQLLLLAASVRLLMRQS